MTAPLLPEPPLPLTTSSSQTKGRVVELLFLGTGTSGGVPNITCITSTTGPACRVCHSSLTPEGRKNLRRNTSLLIRYAHPDGKIRNILIDCGKTFYASALDWFPKYGIQEIHAVILTHGHADAIMGLDDLRPFSHRRLGGPIPVYLTNQTLSVVRGAFPYIVDSNLATGGGEVPRLQFHELSDPRKPFNVLGLEFLPLEVEHGVFADGCPFLCLGFRFDDVGKSPTDHRQGLISTASTDYFLHPLLETKYSSHFGYDQAVEAVREAQPKELAFFTDLTHEWDHATLSHRLSLLPSPPCPVQPAYDGMRLVCQDPLDPWTISSFTRD
ncbi:beta-lactamase-like protein [Piptocephalis cylindrospora]|uniref:Beta-lactamase-like protein n=1 Tax=Piptocephalis cylindrospora TaxID=1907219 RepID=A0A4P9Y4T0_9FUNG|nr:beta-lactamase-like protein [Piptocephalis cylindrospora]|eukprot:RKP13903.1 beta-lactamase-like protein [Piptocephalis cylindrospora]